MRDGGFCTNKSRMRCRIPLEFIPGINKISQGVVVGVFAYHNEKFLL